MSELEGKIGAVLHKFDEDISVVSEKLAPLLDASSIDELSANESSDRKAVPYALSAYALSSMLFAYLRSEGQDTALVMPELARVKEKMEKLNKLDKKNKDAQEDEEANNSGSSNTSASTSKASGKHTRFEASETGKSSKRVATENGAPKKKKKPAKKEKS